MLTVRYRRPVAGDPTPPSATRSAPSPLQKAAPRVPLIAFGGIAVAIDFVAWLFTKSFWESLLCASAFLFPSMYFRRKLAGAQPKAPDEAREADADRIEVIQVEARRVYDIDVPKSMAPALCFELTEHQLLLLSGPWLMEHRLYRAPEGAQKANSARFNGMDDPYGFPSTRFSIHRWKGESQPFWIEVQGWYLLPQMGVAQLREGAKVKPVEIFPASGKDLQAAIDEAFA